VRVTKQGRRFYTETIFHSPKGTNGHVGLERREGVLHRT